MKKLIPVFLAGFFFSAQLALLAYINSSMLDQFVGSRMISLIFAIASAISLVLVFIVPHILHKIGNNRFISIAILASVLMLFIIGTSTSSAVIIPLFICYFSLNTVILYSLDIYVEHYSKRNNIGNIRGFYLTITSLGWLMMPFISGTLINLYSYSVVYLVAALVLLCTMIVLIMSQHHYKDSIYHEYSGGNLFKELNKIPEIRRIITLNFLLQFYFAWMVIYIPLYLKKIIGFNNIELGIIFSAMLLPFVLFEYPAGKIADKVKNGEKKIIILGLITMGIATIGLMMLKSHSVLIFALVLFATRVGASIVQVANDSYFFKRITDREAGIIGLYRNMLSLAYIIGPLLGAALLIFVSYNTLFIILGIILFLGAMYSRRIPNVKNI